MCFFTCPLRKKSIIVTASDQGGQAVGPPCPIHLGYVMFNRCQTDTSSSSPSRSFKKIMISACRQIGAHDNVPDDTNPDADAEADLIPTFASSMRIIPCPGVTVVYI
jgi:hypothetical protein